jgi:hypothetical protein
LVLAPELARNKNIGQLLSARKKTLAPGPTICIMQVQNTTLPPAKATLAAGTAKIPTHTGRHRPVALCVGRNSALREPWVVLQVQHIYLALSKQICFHHVQFEKD